MKSLSFILFCIGSTFMSFSQMPVKALQIGDSMPDIPLGTTINNTTGKHRFSDFRGKAVILINWATWCKPCIAAFPHEESLQQQFSNDIQIILVNTTETRVQMEQRIRQLKLQLPAVPCIVNDTVTKHLFPSRFVGGTTWIDKNGIIKIINANGLLTTTSEKVRRFINGENITYVTSGSIDMYKETFSLHSNMNGTLNPLWAGSIFPYIEKYGVEGGRAIEVSDTLKRIKRNTYINETIFYLYSLASAPLVKSYLEKRIYGPRKNQIRLEPIILRVNDTLRYESTFHTRNLPDNYDFARNHYCYEQIVPWNVNRVQQCKFMLDDLNKYFGSLYGTDGKIDSVSIECYLLVRISKKDKLSHNDSIGSRYASLKKQYKILTRHQSTLKHAIASALTQLNIRSRDYPSYVFDATGINSQVEIYLPDFSEQNSMEDLRNVLQEYGLDLVRSIQSIPMLVIQEL